MKSDQRIAPIEPRTVELTITSDPRSLAVVRGAVSRMAETEGFSSEDAQQITLAIDEALANVIKHGYGGQPDQPIHIKLEATRDAAGRAGLSICVRDFGKQIDPALIKSRDLEDVRPGGLGVHIIRSVMDDVEFTCPRDGGMLLRMVKYVRNSGNSAAPRPENVQP